jgi:hypothetical protein
MEKSPRAGHSLVGNFFTKAYIRLAWLVSEYAAVFPVGYAERAFARPFET